MIEAGLVEVLPTGFVTGQFSTPGTVQCCREHWLRSASVAAADSEHKDSEKCVPHHSQKLPNLA